MPCFPCAEKQKRNSRDEDHWQPSSSESESGSSSGDEQSEDEQPEMTKQIHSRFHEDYRPPSGAHSAHFSRQEHDRTAGSQLSLEEVRASARCQRQTREHDGEVIGTVRLCSYSPLVSCTAGPLETARSLFALETAAK